MGTMTELPLIILALCALAVTWAVVMTSFEWRCTLRRVNTLLPDAELVIKEAKRSLTHVRRVIARADHVSKQVEAVALETCETVSGVVEQVAALKLQAEHSLGRWFGTNGNGARAESRSQRHSRNN